MSPSLLYLKPLLNSNTFLHVIYKSKKKTNLLCILNNVFQYSKIRTRKRNAKKSIKTEKNLESSLFWNPESTELESGIQCPESVIRNPQGVIQNPRLSWIPLHGAIEGLSKLVRAFLRRFSISYLFPSTGISRYTYVM